MPKHRNLAQGAVVGSIKVYQKTLSPDHGLLKHIYPHGYCKFTPTCSEYMAEAVGRFGAVKGVYLGLKRIGRCNPWNEGGEDGVPKITKKSKVKSKKYGVASPR